jgi:hypothetical protein
VQARRGEKLLQHAIITSDIVDVKPTSKRKARRKKPSTASLKNLQQYRAVNPVDTPMETRLRWTGPARGDRPLRMLFAKDLEAIGFGYSDTHQKRLEDAGLCPRRRKLGKGKKSRNYWFEHEMQDCVEGRGHAVPDDGEDDA